MYVNEEKLYSTPVEVDGEEHISTELKLSKWNGAITYYIPCDNDQYGPFRVVE